MRGGDPQESNRALTAAPWAGTVLDRQDVIKPPGSHKLETPRNSLKLDFFERTLATLSIPKGYLLANAIKPPQGDRLL